jgi:hypothetical protein
VSHNAKHFPSSHLTSFKTGRALEHECCHAASFGIRWASVTPACRRRNTGCHAGCPPAACHFASDKDNVSVTILAGWRRFSSARVSSWLPASRLAVLCALTEIVMRAHSTSSRAARRWHCTVGIRWQRWQSAVSGLYFRRVTAPVQFWLACGRPAAFRPALPWWHQLVYSYLRLTGWLRAGRPERPV